MRHWRNKLLLLAGASSLLLAIPALSQEAPKSILPPGFGDPEAPLPPRVEEPPPGDTPAPPGVTPSLPRSAPPPPGQPDTIDSVAQDLQLVALPPPSFFEIPDHAQRPTDVIGFLEPGNWGLGAGAFGNANGALLSTLMRRLDAPLPSRWTSMLLRRALLSRVPAPPYVDPVDWVAERAWLLLRMGEADAARMLVQSVDVDRYTPSMIRVAVQTALATADPAALCPLVEPGRASSDEPVWPLSEAMCAALEGEAARASSLIDRARRRSGAGGIDLLLAEKVVGAGTDTRRAVTIQWDDVDSVNAWRFGLASATGLQIPERLMNNVGPHVQAWLARAPMLPLGQRMGAAQVAASLGVFSSDSLVEMHSLILDNTDPSEVAGTVGARLRTAYVSRDMNQRMEAMRGLWSEAEGPHRRHAQSILTAAAASRIPPSEAYQTDAANLVASMLSAGMDKQAARWAEIASASDASGDLAWALLAVGAPQPIDLDVSRIEAFRGPDDGRGDQRGRLLVAALAGLDRIAGGGQELASSMGVDIAGESRWSRLLQTAVRNRQPGTVALIAAVGMQTGDWTGVPPAHLFHIVRALRQVGLEFEARMIAAEALSRL